MEAQDSIDAVDGDVVAREHSDLGGPVETVPLSDLLPAVNAPRLNGEDAEHVSVLASSDAVLPPILVHRGSLRVIDGSHRLRAARLRGAYAIQVVYFDGSDEEAFVAAVKANTTHGLPLSLADRKAAAAHILSSFPYWSDRAIARIAGLAAKTVAGIRRPTEDAQRLDRRVGTDGRVRPVNGSAGRLRAAEAIRSQPGASLRDIAHAAGVSPMTARDVRVRLERGDMPTILDKPRPQPATSSTVRRTVPRQPTRGTDPTMVLQKLSRDPSLRQAETGRTLLRWLDAQARAFADYPSRIEQVPPHCLYALIELAHAFAGRWRAHAKELEQRLEALVSADLHG